MRTWQRTRKAIKKTTPGDIALRNRGWRKKGMKEATLLANYHKCPMSCMRVSAPLANTRVNSVFRILFRHSRCPLSLSLSLSSASSTWPITWCPPVYPPLRFYGTYDRVNLFSCSRNRQKEAPMPRSRDFHARRESLSRSLFITPRFFDVFDSVPYIGSWHARRKCWAVIRLPCCSSCFLNKSEISSK